MERQAPPRLPRERHAVEAHEPGETTDEGRQGDETPERMNVLHVIPSLGPLRGGPSTALPAMVQGLARSGLTVHVATTDDNGRGRMKVPLGEPVVQGGVTTRYFPRQTNFYTASWPLTRWLARHVRDYDVLHIHALFSYPSTAAAFVARRHRVPYVLRPLGTLNHWGMAHRRPWLKRASLRLIERRILAGASAVHYTSDGERREARELGLGGRSVVIPLGVDPAAFEGPGAPERLFRTNPQLVGRPIVLFLSRVHPVKGLDILLPAFAELRRRRPEVALLIAGEGERDYLARLRADAQRLGVADHVVWAGFLAGDDKRAAFAAATLFVLPSYSENLGIAALEAMAAGLPVIVSDRIGFAAAVQQSEAGIVLPCDAGALASALERLVSDTDLRRRLGANGDRLVRERFSVEATTRDLIALYEGVAHGGPRAKAP